MTVFLTVTTWSSNWAILGLSCDLSVLQILVYFSLRFDLVCRCEVVHFIYFGSTCQPFSSIFFHLRFHLRFLRHFFQLFSQCFTSVMRSLPGLLDQYLNPSVAQINLSTINQIVIPSAYLLSALRLEGAHYIHLLQPRQHPLLFYFST